MTPPGGATSKADPDCPQCHGAGFVKRSRVTTDGPTPEPGDFSDVRRCDCDPPAFDSGFPERFKDARFDTFSVDRAPKMTDAVVRCESVAHGLTWAVCLYGRPGIGKTHLAFAALHEWRRECWRDSWGYAWQVPDLLAYLRSLIDREGGPSIDSYVDMLGRGPFLLVLDDLAAEKDTEWGREQLFRIIDLRYRTVTPLVVTSNAPGGLKTIDSRITDRLRGHIVVCEGETQRGRA